MGEYRYWNYKRIIASILWLISLVAVPWGLIELEYLPEGSGFVPFSLLLALGSILYLQRAAFRVGTVLVVTSAFFVLFQPDFLAEVLLGLNYRMQDTFFNLRGPKKPTGQVVIVDIDQKSLERVGQWPWPRTEVAKMIRVLQEDGARVVGFDIVFAEQDSLSLQSWIERLQLLGGNIQLPDRVPAEKVEEIALTEWGLRLSAEDPVQGYLHEAKQSWDERELAFYERAQAGGWLYIAKPYLAPSNPVAEMITRSPELFYINDENQLIRDNDQDLAEAMQEAHVVAGGLFITPTSAGSRVASYHKKEARNESEGMVVSKGIQGAPKYFRGMRRALEQVVNIPEVQFLAYHQGMFNIVPDQSGSARYYTMLMQAPVWYETLALKSGKEDSSGEERLNPDNYESKILSQHVTYPSITLEMLRVANGYDVVEPGSRGGRQGLVLRRENGFEYEQNPVAYTEDAFPGLLPQEFFVPLDFKADIPINFLGYGGAWQPEYQYGPEYYLPYVSIVDVIHRDFKPGTFKDKYVIIGSTDATLSDLVGSPFRPAFPGLEVHATMLDNLISGDVLVDYSEWNALVTFLGILICGLLLTLALAYAHASVAGFILVATLAGLPAISYVNFAYYNTISPFVYPWLCMLSTGIVTILVNYFIEGREGRFVSEQFSKMVSEDVLKRLQEDHGEASLSGQRAEISVFFSDVASFTTISESLAPADLVNLLNEYMTPMVDIIMEDHGFVDKFIGDAIMACWGVPFPDSGHAVKACRAAIDQQKKIDEIAPYLKEKYGVDISVRMGVASGEVSAALMGSASRKSYTVMGDVVNLGARLEPACKDYGVAILISETTYQMAKDHIVARCVDKLVVKGKTVPIPVYELIGMREDIGEDKRVDLFEKALHLHWDRKWDEALATLRDVEAIAPEDGPTHNLTERIHHYQESPPSENWHGEFVKTTK